MKVFKEKEINVALVGDAKMTYLQLVDVVSKEHKVGKYKSDHQILLNSIERTINCLKKDPQYGIHIKKKQIPKYYLNKFEVQNLWKCDLANFWRLIYWIDGSSEVRIVSFVLDIMDHKIYDKKFKYKKT